MDWVDEEMNPFGAVPLGTILPAQRWISTVLPAGLGNSSRLHLVG